jgi:hypothetical protein
LSFTFKNANRGLHGEAVHEAVELILGERHGFVRSTRPLIDTISQAFHDHAEAVPVKTDSFDTVPLVPAEQEERPVFQWIKAILKPYDRYQSCNTPAQISSAALDYDPLAPCSIPNVSFDI